MTPVRSATNRRRWIGSIAGLICFAPGNPQRHRFILSAIFLVVDKGYILLVDHINAGLWLPSGGQVEPNEDPRDTVRREVVEELGTAAEFLKEAPQFLTSRPSVGKDAQHSDVVLWFQLRGDRGAVLDFDRAEFHKVQWFLKDGLLQTRVVPELARFMAKLSAP